MSTSLTVHVGPYAEFLVPEGLDTETQAIGSSGAKPLEFFKR